MSMRDLVPRWGKTNTPARSLEDGDLFSFHREINRLFDSFFSQAGLMPTLPNEEATAGSFTPRVNVSETDKDIRVVAELPGLDEKEVTVEVVDDAVIIRGEKREEREEKDANWHRVEHRYGSFHRIVPLPVTVDDGNAKAAFRKGVLTVTLPKRPDAESKRKRIAVKAE